MRDLVHLDFAQLDARMNAMFGGTDTRDDPHTLAAAKAHGISPADVTPKQRREAKAAAVREHYSSTPVIHL